MEGMRGGLLDEQLRWLEFVDHRPEKAHHVRMQHGLKLVLIEVCGQANRPVSALRCFELLSPRLNLRADIVEDMRFLAGSHVRMAREQPLQPGRPAAWRADDEDEV